MPNTNCLAGIKCPKCSSEGPFRIACLVTCVVHDDGVDSYESPEWYDDDSCSCMACSFAGDVATFSTETKEVTHA